MAIRLRVCFCSGKRKDFNIHFKHRLYYNYYMGNNIKPLDSAERPRLIFIFTGQRSEYNLKIIPFINIGSERKSFRQRTISSNFKYITKNKNTKNTLLSSQI